MEDEVVEDEVVEDEDGVDSDDNAEKVRFNDSNDEEGENDGLEDV